jgi:hypothetical protein
MAVLWQPQPQLRPGQGLQAQELISASFMAFSLVDEDW